MFDELDTVVLASDIKKYGLKRGGIGTVVYTYSDKKAIKAEFLTAEGETIAVLTLKTNEIRPIAKDEILHVREFASFV